MAVPVTAEEYKAPCQPIRLTHLKPPLNVHKTSFSTQELALATRPDLWHKFILFDDGEHEKEELLMCVMSFSAPDILLPLMCKVESPKKITFIAKCSFPVLENLAKQNLRLKLNDGQTLKIDIVLGFAGMNELKQNPAELVAQALYYRYEPIKKILNLDNFKNEKTLGPIFCPLSLQSVLTYVLRCSKAGILGIVRDTKLPVRELSIRNNGITSITQSEKLFTYHLTKIDLRYNKIMDIESLGNFLDYKIMEIWLDGNPLCANYSTPDEYVRAVKTVFPHLQKLDGISIGVETKFVPVMQPNYVGDETKVDLIKQFVKHFFTLYDQHDRIVMNGLYDANAFYSMTLGTVPNYKLRAFMSNRNLLKFVDYAKCRELLLHGPENIISTLRREPPTIHYLKTFHIDLLHHTENHLAIAIQGLFHYKELIGPIMSFNRTFIIIAKGDNEYSIINDQYHIGVAPASLANTADISHPKFQTKDVPKFTPTLLSVSEKDQLLHFLHELTTMNAKYCQIYLDQAGWDIRKAITSFTKAYTVNDVPSEAFQELEQQQYDSYYFNPYETFENFNA